MAAMHEELIQGSVFVVSGGGNLYRANVAGRPCLHNHAKCGEALKHVEVMFDVWPPHPAAYRLSRRSRRHLFVEGAGGIPPHPAPPRLSRRSRRHLLVEGAGGIPPHPAASRPISPIPPVPPAFVG
jgi:hypothetical protein